MSRFQVLARRVNEVCFCFGGFFATSNDSFLPPFRDHLSIPCSSVKQSKAVSLDGWFVLTFMLPRLQLIVSFETSQISRCVNLKTLTLSVASWYDVVWCYMMWCDMVWYVMWYGIWCDVIWYMLCDVIWYDMKYDTSCDMVRYDMWCDMVWYDVYGTIYDMMWCDMV